MANDDVLNEGKRGLSRRQLLAGSAGLAGALAGAGLLSRGETVLAASAAGTTGTGPASVQTAGAGSVDMFLKLDRIPGESQDTQHLHEIDVLSYSFGLADRVTYTATGIRPGKPNFSSISIVKYVDLATPLLFTACWTGKPITTGKLVLRKSGVGNTSLDFLKIILTNVVVAAIAPGGSSDRPTESVALNFTKIEIDFTYVDAKGTPVTESGMWDLQNHGSA